jgi:hypothetical protein
MATAEVLGVLPFGPGSSLRSYSENRPASPLRAVEREMLRSTFNSHYIRRIQKLENLIDETKGLSRLAKNWDSYGAMPPADPAIMAALKFLFTCVKADLLPVRILPSAEGGIALRFVAGDKRALVEFLNSGSIEVMLYDEAGALSPEIEEMAHAEDVADAVHAYLTR